MLEYCLYNCVFVLIVADVGSLFTATVRSVCDVCMCVWICGFNCHQPPDDDDDSNDDDRLINYGQVVLT